MTELTELSAAEARALFAARELSPVELMRAVQERMDAAEPQINALTERMDAEALELARTAEEAFGASPVEELPPLLGVPVATKEKHAIAGRGLSQGLAQTRVIAEVDSTVVARIRAAGGIVHARTTSPQFSCATFTHSPLWGVTGNPWNPERSPGGSSGGAGAALAAGYAPLATASDIAGSTRLPAGFTGTVGYKAPYGRIPGAPPLSLDWYRGDGPMARTVADAALLTGVLSGVDPLDASSLPAPREIDAWPGLARAAEPRGLRVGLAVTLGDYPVEAEVAEAVRATAQHLTSAGAEVVEIELPWTTELIREVSFTHFGHLLAPSMRASTAGHEEHLADYTLRFMADAEATAARRSFYEGLAMEARIHADLAAAMADVDVLLCPVSAVASLPAEGSHLDGIEVAGRHLEHYWEAHMTSPFNIANRAPVLAVPTGHTSGGVPIGVQIVGHAFDEASVFAVGGLLEQLAPWARLAPR